MTQHPFLGGMGLGILAGAALSMAMEPKKRDLKRKARKAAKKAAKQNPTEESK